MVGLCAELAEHVDDFLRPHCAGWGGQVAFVRDRHAFVEITPTEWGHEFCRAFFDHRYFDQKGAWTQSALNQFNHDHPNLYRPFLIEGLMRRDYDTSMGVSLATFRKVVERTVDESIRRGIVRVRAPADYVPGTTNVFEFEQPSASDDERFQAIYEEAFCAIAKPSPKEAERNSVTCPSGSQA